jgi:hypothetical protein
MTGVNRIKLQVELPGRQPEEARVLPTLTAMQFIDVILAEFRNEIEHLSDVPARYQLVRGDGAVLDDDRPLGDQVRDGLLHLVERRPQLPAGTTAPPRPCYLRDLASGTVYPILWLPALIGRSDASLPNNELIAVDLAGAPAGRRVSRRHVRLADARGQLAIARVPESHANPVQLRRADGTIEEVAEVLVVARHGDVLVLPHSQIELKVLLPA